MEFLNSVWSGNIIKSSPLDRINPTLKLDKLNQFRKLRGADRTKLVIEFFDSLNPFQNYEVLPKSGEYSAELRNKGNCLYKGKQFREALKAYNLSLCFSPPNGTEYYRAIANRSALFFQLEEFEACQKDLELVLGCESDSPEIAQLKSKLGARLEKCTKALKEKEISGAGKEVLEYFTLKTQNPQIPSAENFLMVRSNRDRGRHVVTSKRVPPGTLLIVEDPFAKVLLQQFRWDVNHCHTCLHPISNGVPCKSCVFEIFCSSACAEARDPYPCEISSYLHFLNPSRNLLLATKIVTLQGAQKLYELFKSLPPTSATQKSNPPSFDSSEDSSSEDKAGDMLGFKDGVYSSSDYNTIYNLIYHQANATELYQYTLDAVAVVQALWQFSTFFESHRQDPEFRVFIIELIIRHLRNLPPNAHSLNELQDLSLVEYGAGAYSLLSLINHSCDPNVTRFNLPNGKVAVVTVKSIQEGGELQDNYGVHYAINKFLERQKHLTKHYYFNCDCEPCSKNWPLYKELKFRDQISLFNVGGYAEVAAKFEALFEKVMGNEEIPLRELLDCMNFFENNFQLPFSKFNEAQETFKHYMNVTIRKIFGRNDNL